MLIEPCVRACLCSQHVYVQPHPLHVVMHAFSSPRLSYQTNCSLFLECLLSGKPLLLTLCIRVIFSSFLVNFSLKPNLPSPLTTYKTLPAWTTFLTVSYCLPFSFVYNNCSFGTVCLVVRLRRLRSMLAPSCSSRSSPLIR